MKAFKECCVAKEWCDNRLETIMETCEPTIRNIEKLIKQWKMRALKTYGQVC